jgi:UDP-2,4-diacetamido-2,4,6-trideoxy-beta-L-altropyranose hydrolase
MRCLTLADALREQGAQCRFICRAHEEHLMNMISERGYQVNALPKPDSEMRSTVGDLAHARWLGVDWSTDAQQTQQFLADTKFDWVIVDHYALDHRWESALRSVCNHMMVIDDLADRRHDCDLLLDQNHGSCSERYAGLVPAECTQLHGPEFALLKPVYAKHRAEQRVRSDKIERVLIYFGGGADPMNLTEMALRAFQAPELMKIELDIVVGSGYAHKEELETAAGARGKTRIHTQLPDLSELMVNADLAIGAGGATTWERCCLGLPSIVISIAENQRPACEALSAEKLIDYLGHVDQVTSEMIRDRIPSFAKNSDLLRDLSERGMKLVDGCGTDRILDEVRAIS